MEDILKIAKSFQEEIVKHRRNIHKNPEIDSELPETTNYVMNALKSYDYKPQVICKSGVSAIVSGNNPGKTILIRADMDALPIKEETELPYKSNNNNMHACGHDMHTAMLLGAAKILKELENRIKGNVKFMFQPAEETLNGAQGMIDNGILESPKVDAAIALHVTTASLPTGKIGYLTGPMMASSDNFMITIIGKGGHAANPHDTKDPINTAVHIYTALQTIRDKEISSSKQTTLNIAMFQAGRACNVIPDKAVLKGTLRTYNDETREYILKRLNEISVGTAKIMNTSASIEILDSVPVLSNNESFTNEILGYASDILGKDCAVRLEEKLSGSEDFSLILNKVPGCLLMFGAGEKKDGYNYPLHHPKAEFDESVLYKGSAILAYFAIKWLENNN